MKRFLASSAGAWLLAATGFCAPSTLKAFAQTPTANRVPVRIDESRVVTLAGNVHPLARAEFEMGPVPADMRMQRMMMLLKPSASQQTELDALVEKQQDPHSAQYHQWLTPAEYGTRFGASKGDLQRLTRWLTVHGFTIDEVAPNHRLIVFSGNVGQIADTFHAEMRRFSVNGAMHVSNVDDPQIPAALETVVAGIVSLHDFQLARALESQRARPLPEWNLSGSHYLFPADFASIYDLNPLYGGGITGKGVSIAIAGRSNINLSDVTAFRSAAGLPANSPMVVVNGSNPGLVQGDQDESTLDVEWAGAIAPSASVTLVATASGATDGIDQSAAYIVNHALAQVMSVSYSSCEQSMGSAELAFYNSLWQQAASEGISVLVASGDSGAAGCDQDSAQTGTVAAVNGICSSPYATCVGGTEFNDGGNPAQYWSDRNGTNGGSALGYIPETVWNESASAGGNALWASGGGASKIYTQPIWQADVSGTAVSNGMRAVPDVSLTAAIHDGYTIYENGGSSIVSGTSAATPSFAGLMALIVQAKSGQGQGNANPGLYAMVTSSRNPFHTTTTGNNSVPGVAGFSASGTAYNLATGLGSVDAALFVHGWGQEDAVRLPVRPRGAPSRRISIPVR